MSMWIEDEIERIQRKLEDPTLDGEERGDLTASLMEYQGRVQSIEAERAYLNGEQY